MSFSFDIGSIFGIRIRVHWLFFVLLVYFLFQGGIPAAVWICLVFSFVVFHELGHSLVARHYGLQVRKITLLPIGGMAHLEGEMPSPNAELWVASAGPIVSLGFAGIFFALTMLSGSAAFAFDLTLLGSMEQLFTGMFWINLFLGVFNLIPAFPMDGGRILRALLAKRKGMTEATIIAARVGRYVAILMGVYGLIRGDFILILIAVFIFMAGKQEEMVARFRGAGNPLNEILRNLSRGMGPNRRPRQPDDFYEGCAPMDRRPDDQGDSFKSLFENNGPRDRS